MAVRPLALPWRSQPQVPVEINRDNGFAAGLVFAANFSANRWGAIEGAGTVSTSGTIADAITNSSRYGTLRGFGGTNSVWAATNPNNTLRSTGPFTHAFLARISSIDLPYGSIFYVGDTGDRVSFSLQRNSNADSLLLYRGSNVGHTFPAGTASAIADGKPHLVIASSAGISAGDAGALWIDGVKYTGAHPGNNGTTAFTNISLRLLSYTVGDTAFGSDGDWYNHWAWSKFFTDAEAQAFTDDPWQVFEPRRIMVPVAAAAGGAITGSSSATFNLTGSAAGAVSIAGDGSATFALTGSAAGTVGITGSSSATFSLTGSASGSVPVAGTSSATFALSATSAGAVLVAGASSATFDLAGSAAGTAVIAGASSTTLDLAGSAAGAVAVAGASAVTLDLTGSAAAVALISGSSTATFTLTGTGEGTLTNARFGASSVTFDLTGSATGSVLVQAASDTTFSLAGSATAAALIAGTSSATFDLTGAATGTTTGAITGASSATFELTGTATAEAPIGGASAATIALLGAAEGQIVVGGSSSSTFELLGSGTGTVGATGGASAAAIAAAVWSREILPGVTAEQMLATIYNAITGASAGPWLGSSDIAAIAAAVSAENLSVNVQYVNGVRIRGSGVAGDTWGPE